jgi:hypothetical protein
MGAFLTVSFLARNTQLASSGIIYVSGRAADFPLGSATQRLQSLKPMRIAPFKIDVGCEYSHENQLRVL